MSTFRSSPSPARNNTHRIHACRCAARLIRTSDAQQVPSAGRTDVPDGGARPTLLVLRLDILHAFRPRPQRALYLRANIKPLCRFIKFVRRERDHDRIIGYDNVNQLFWYPEDIARTVLTDKVCQPFMTQINVLISLCQTLVRLVFSIFHQHSVYVFRPYRLELCILQDDQCDECVSFLRSLIPPALKQRGACIPSWRQYAESVSALHSVAMQLTARPETLPSYKLCLYPLSIERSVLLAQLEVEERNSLESAESAHELERERVEEESKRDRDRIRDRLLRQRWIPRSHSRYCPVFHLYRCNPAIWNYALQSGAWYWVASKSHKYLASQLSWQVIRFLHLYLQCYWVLLCLACLLVSLTIFVQLDIYHVLIYLQLYLALFYFVYLLISLTIFVHLQGFITLVPSLLSLLSGVSMTKSGQIKSKFDKSN